MRETKFRVWDKVNKKLLTGNLSLDTLLSRPQQYDLEQFTGLKDKNGREIYEGDIMQFDEKQVGVWPDQCKPHEVKYPFVCGNAHLGEIIGTIHDKEIESEKDKEKA